MKKISVVIPMYYEEEVAQECYSKMTQVLLNIKDYEIIDVGPYYYDK